MDTSERYSCCSSAILLYLLCGYNGHLGLTYSTSSKYIKLPVLDGSSLAVVESQPAYNRQLCFSTLQYTSGLVGRIVEVTMNEAASEMKVLPNYTAAGEVKICIVSIL